MAQTGVRRGPSLVEKPGRKSPPATWLSRFRPIGHLASRNHSAGRESLSGGVLPLAWGRWKAGASFCLRARIPVTGDVVRVRRAFPGAPPGPLVGRSAARAMRPSKWHVRPPAGPAVSGGCRSAGRRRTFGRPGRRCEPPRRGRCGRGCGPRRVLAGTFRRFDSYQAHSAPVRGHAGLSKGELTDLTTSSQSPDRVLTF